MLPSIKYACENSKPSNDLWFWISCTRIQTSHIIRITNYIPMYKKYISYSKKKQRICVTYTKMRMRQHQAPSVTDFKINFVILIDFCIGNEKRETPIASCPKCAQRSPVKTCLRHKNWCWRKCTQTSSTSIWHGDQTIGKFMQIN